MLAKYDFKKNPKSNDDEEETLHPRLVYNGTVSTEQMFKEIAEASTYTEADLEGMLTAITNRMSHHMINGYRVELGKIGYFSAKLKAIRPVKDKNEIRSPSIYFDNINFRASAWFRKHTRGFVERAEAQFGLQQSSDLTEEVCKQRMLDYIEKHGYITRVDYTQITGKLKNKALEELNRFVEQGIIQRQGRGVKLMFIKKM